MVDFRCPNCDQRIALRQPGDATQSEEITCPSCHSRFAQALDETRTFAGNARFTVGHFETVEFLGEGSFGSVFKARDTQLDRMVALKLPREGPRSERGSREFLNEAQSAAQIQHPNVVQVHEIGLHQGSYYIASEFIDGVTLADWLKHHRPTPHEAAALGEKICRAVQAAHEKRVIHRDLKPGNILMDVQGEPHVADFGLARRERAHEMSVTQSGRIIGTPLYMSPEQARGDSRNTTHRSDIYSLGVILYELLTGTTPFRASGSHALLHRIRTEEPTSPRSLQRGLHRDLETICLKALRKEPENRYATAGEMADDLQRYLRGEPIQARPISVAERAWRTIRRHPVVSALTAALLVALGLVFVLVAVSRRPVEPAALTHPVVLGARLANENAPPPSTTRWAIVPLDPDTRLLLADRCLRPNPGSSIELALEPGEYLVVVEAPGVGFHEVYRRVPADPESSSGWLPHSGWKLDDEGRVVLPTVTILPTEQVTANMVMIEGGSFIMGAGLDAISPPHERAVESYYLDRTEVMLADFAESNLRPAAEAIIAERPGDFPVVEVNWGTAVAYAESVGKRLMSEAEYEFAATNRGATQFPWGHDESLITEWSYGPVGTPAFDVSNAGVRGLFSNVVEWTDSIRLPYPGGHPLPDILHGENRTSRAIRGGPQQAEVVPDAPPPWSDGVKVREALDARRSAANVGFRCARSVAPRFLAEPPGS